MLGLDICRDSHYPSASGGYGLLVPSDRAVICSAKPLRSYLLADFIKRYINKLILYIYKYNFLLCYLKEQNCEIWCCLPMLVARPQKTLCYVGNYTLRIIDARHKNSNPRRSLTQTCSQTASSSCLSLTGRQSLRAQVIPL